MLKMMQSKVEYLIEKGFFKQQQRLLELFIFFSIFPIIKIFGITISFFFGIILFYNFFRKGLKLFTINKYTEIFLLLFVVFVLISSLIPEETYRSRAIYHYFKIPIQYIYWVLIAFFIKTWILYFNVERVFKVSFYALVIATVHMFLFNHIYYIYPPNAYAYIVVAIYPIASIYIQKNFNFIIFSFISFIFIIAVFLIGSRTGFSLVLFEYVVLLLVGGKIRRFFIYVLIMISVPVILYVGINFDFENLRYKMADQVEPYSPKIARALYMGEKLKELDKSYLTRLLMIEKGKKIFEKHPFFGVGAGNFTYYGEDINPRALSKHLHKTIWSYNKTSPQNSFLMILAENGIFATISLGIVFLVILFKGLKFFFIIQNDVRLNFYISFIALFFYSFILVTTMGTLFWILMGFYLIILYKNVRI